VSEAIPPLDPGLLGPLREAEPAPAVVRARARQRLLNAVGGLGGPGGPGGDAAGGGKGVRPGVPRIPTAIAFVLGAVVGVGVYAALAPAAAPRTIYVDRVVPPPSAEPVAKAAATATIEAVPAPGAAQAASAAPSTRGSQLSAERILLDEARAALAQGDPVRAIDRLERHRRTFAVPLLAEERDAMWVQALVKAGRYDEARAHASAFQKRSPDSLFSSVVDSAIDSIP
jgi:hypothetical protein